MAHAPTTEPTVQPEDDRAVRGLRDVPALPLRVGRHVTAWLLWHTSRVSLVEEDPRPANLDRAARV